MLMRPNRLLKRVLLLVVGGERGAVASLPEAAAAGGEWISRWFGV
jgi:hypothetical protein